MPRKPQRLVPKRQLQTGVTAVSFEHLQELATWPPILGASTSELVETLLFWSMHEYHERADGAFASLLLRAKALELLELENLKASRPRKHLHLTIDIQADAFLTEFASLHAGAFTGRSDVLDQIIALAWHRHKMETAYFSERIEEVRRMHPKN